MIKEILKIISMIKNKIQLIVGRAILKSISNNEKIIKISCEGLKNESVSDIELLQNYGFESYPDIEENFEAVIFYIGGNRDMGLALSTHNRNYRPKNLSPGNVCVYDKLGNNILLSDNGIKIIDKNGNFIELKDGTGEIEIKTKDNKKIKINNSGILMLGATKSFVLGEDLNTYLTNHINTYFNLHTHISTPAGNPTSPPSIPAVAPSGILSTTIKGE